MSLWSATGRSITSGNVASDNSSEWELGVLQDCTSKWDYVNEQMVNFFRNNLFKNKMTIVIQCLYYCLSLCNKIFIILLVPLLHHKQIL